MHRPHRANEIFLGSKLSRERDRFAAVVPDTLQRLPLVDVYAILLFDADPPSVRTRRGAAAR